MRGMSTRPSPGSIHNEFNDPILHSGFNLNSDICDRFYMQLYVLAVFRSIDVIFIENMLVPSSSMHYAFLLQIDHLYGYFLIQSFNLTIFCIAFSLSLCCPVLSSVRCVFVCNIALVNQWIEMKLNININEAETF